VWLIGCGGGAGQGNSSNSNTPIPTVSISASPSTITEGQSTTLTWSTNNAVSCTASGAWSGSEQTNGSASVTPTSTGNVTYTLTCSGNGSASASTTVTVNAAPTALRFTAIPPIMISLGTKISTVDISQYVQGGSAPFAYSLVSQTAPNAIACALSGATLSSDYAYQGGVNTITLQVTDSKQASATTTVTVTVAVPTVASQAYGIDFSPYENGQDPSTGVDISIDQITQRMGIIVPYTKWLRSYRSTHGQENIGAIAHKFGRNVCMGAWITSDTSVNGTNAAEMTNLIAHAQNGEADCAVIGSEVLFRGDNNMGDSVTPAQLIVYIDQFRAAVPNVPVTSADAYASLLLHPEVVNDCDFIFANYYPYWEGKDLPVALAHLNAEDALLRHTYSGKEVIVSETGWPSGGNVKGSAVPSLMNAASYFLNFRSWVQAGQRKAFYFEATDEAWKATPDAPQQALFGIFDQNGVMKYGSDVFAGATVPDNWTCATAPGGNGTAAIQLTSVPPIGSNSLLQGQVTHIIPGGYYVVVYIHVGSNGWWVKPFTTAPLTFIDCDGTWTTNIVTGGNDASADQIAAFLIPSTYNPPLLTGAQTLPADLYNNAAASVTVNRP